MQRNRDGSWTLSASAYGGSGNVNGGYPPQATHVYSNFNLQQQHIINNLQAQQRNLNFHPHQFGAAASVFLPNRRQGCDNVGSRIHGSSSSKPNRNVELMRIDNAVIETRKSMIASGKSVSSELILAQLQAGSIGLQSLHDVPSFKQLMAIEGKLSFDHFFSLINAFIHCFIGARRIVTLYDLEVAICRNESVYCFDDLELGPLLQHPLVTHYFSSVSGSVGAVKITSEEIISLLDSYLNTCDMEDVKLDGFLSFVAEEKSVTCKEKLGVRIQNLRMYVSFIQETKRQEGETLEMLLTELHQKYHNLSSKKQRQGKSFTVEDLHRKDYCGKHTSFHSSSSDNHLSNSPYPSAAEEKQLGISKKKRKSGSRIHEKSDSPEVLKKVPSKVHQGNPKKEKLKPADDSDTDVVARNDNCSDTSSQTDKPDPSRPMPTKSSSTSGNLAHELTDLNFKDLFQSGTPWIAQAQQTGKKGEQVAYRYFAAKHGKEAVVRWVNDQSETGLPYDVVIEHRGGKKEYVEVKATVTAGKDYFNLTVNEWQFAYDKGESYSIAHVLLGNSNAILTQHRNVVKLCNDGHLKLLILMPNQRNDVNFGF